MSAKHKNIVRFSGQTSENWFCLSLADVTHSFGVSSQVILEIINEGIVDSVQNEEGELIFSNDSLVRIKKVLQFKEDLGINIAGSALVLELLQEIEHLNFLLSKQSGKY